MKKRLTRLALVGSLAVAVSVPAAPAQAWTCLGTVGEALCLVVGTSCRAFDRVTGRGEICQLS